MSDADLRRLVRVVNSRGMHARPCHAVVSTALEFDAELSIELRGRKVNGKSILELMTLQASCGTELALEAHGADAPALLDRLEDLIGSGFGESS